jgi:arabinofuranosyltransferase
MTRLNNKDELADKWAFRIFWVLLAAYCAKYAWLAEDAFINFRVIDNLRAGDGLIWNPGERVQVFTSMLWMLLTSAVALLTGEEMYTTLAVSFLLVVGVFWQLYRAAGLKVTLFLPLAVTCASSASLRDYFSSGLETPLLMFVLGCFFVDLADPLKVSIRRLSFLVGLSMLVRHDAVLLTAPFLIHFAWTHARQASGWLKIGCDMALGLTPVVVWSVFALVYYGALLPNTAQAKMVSSFDTLGQAFAYFGYMQHFDPVSYLLIGAALALLMGLKSPYIKPMIGALFLFFVYLLKVGADYMAGRFLVGPLIICVFLLQIALRQAIDAGDLRWPSRGKAPALGVLTFMFGLQVLVLPNVSTLKPYRPLPVHGVTDERHHYYGSTDLGTLLTEGVQHHFKDDVGLIKDASSEHVFVSCNIGILGYFAGRQTYIVDPYALSDRFLSGLPMRAGKVRIGHFERVVPSDYINSLEAGANVFVEPALRRYFDDVRLIVSGQLFTVARWAAIWRVNSGADGREVSALMPGGGGGPLQVAMVDREGQSDAQKCMGSRGGVLVPDRSRGLLTLRLLR